MISPFKEEWLNPKDKEKYDSIYTKQIKKWKDYGKTGYEETIKRSKSDI